MKRYVLFFLAWASTLSLFAEDPRYFRELYDENAPLEQRYNYLLGKRISVEKDIAFFYDKSIQAYKQNSSVWDLEAKANLLWKLGRTSIVLVGREEGDEWKLPRLRALDMQVNLFRDIFEEYFPEKQEELEGQLRERIREYIELRTQESHKRYLEAMFARDRNRFIANNIFPYDFIRSLVGNYHDNLPVMLDFYDKSLLGKGGKMTLSKYVKIEYPKKTQLIQRLEILEKEREAAASAAKKLPDRVDVSATKEGSAPPASPVVEVSDNSIRRWHFFAAIAVISPLVGLFLWLKIRSREKKN
ncbi:MAG: hypothetical protein IKW49_00515 [Opitutales bacterium]|nr:hypothetical protein [Opitutales bacterium]